MQDLYSALEVSPKAVQVPPMSINLHGTNNEKHAYLGVGFEWIH